MAAVAFPFAAVRGAPAQAPPDWRLSKETEWPDFARLFEDAGAPGTVVLLDALRGGRLVAGRERAQQGFLPGQTFRIPATLVALHVGAAKDLDERFPAAPCGGDLPLRDAFRQSCAPVFQELARRIGADAFKEWLTKFDYGDAEIGGAALDQFWMTGDLRISADEQTKFLRRLITKTLPISPRAISLTEDAMFVQRFGDAALHGGGGAALDSKPGVGWWVGYAQRGEDVVVAALNAEIGRADQEKTLGELAQEAFRRVRMIV